MKGEFDRVCGIYIFIRRVSDKTRLFTALVEGQGFHVQVEPTSIAILFDLVALV